MVRAHAPLTWSFLGFALTVAGLEVHHMLQADAPLPILLLDSIRQRPRRLTYPHRMP